MGRYDTFNVLVPKRDKKRASSDSHYNDKIDNRPGRPAGITRDDPLYGTRIMARAKDPFMKMALWRLDTWPPKASEEG